MLFKPFKGPSSRFSLENVPFHDGWCYFTTDNGKFYIDSKEEDGTEKRTCINEGSVVEAILSADKWKSGMQTISIEGLTAQQNGMIGLAQSASDEQIEAAQKAELRLSSQMDGLLTILAKKSAPECDIPVTILLFR